MASSTKMDQPDEQLQVKVLEFAEAFMSCDIDRLMELLSGDYRFNDNRKPSVAAPLPSLHSNLLPFLPLSVCSYKISIGARSLHPNPPFLRTERSIAHRSPALGALNLDRDAFRAHMSGLYAATETLTVEPLSVQGSCAPGSFAALEWVLTLKMKGEVPSQMAQHFPPDVPAGGEAKWVGISLLWWNEEGKIKIQKDHGRCVWEGFDMEEAKKIR